MDEVLSIVRLKIWLPQLTKGVLLVKSSKPGSGICFTVTTWLTDAWHPEALVTVSVTVKLCIPDPVALKVCAGFICVDVLLVPEAGSPKFHAKVRPDPVEVFVNCTGTLAQPEAGEKVNAATGFAGTVTVTCAVACGQALPGSVTVSV